MSRVVGCFKDTKRGLHALPTLLFTQNKDANPLAQPESHGGYACKDKFMENLVCRCAEEAKEQHFQYFGIGNFGEFLIFFRTFPYGIYLWTIYFGVNQRGAFLCLDKTKNKIYLQVNAGQVVTCLISPPTHFPLTVLDQ